MKPSEMTPKLKLSAAQYKLLSLMSQGWVLHISTSISGGPPWVSKSGESNRRVNAGTVQAMMVMGRISGERKFPSYEAALTAKGREALAAAKPPKEKPKPELGEVWGVSTGYPGHGYPPRIRKYRGKLIKTGARVVHHGQESNKSEDRFFASESEAQEFALSYAKRSAERLEEQLTELGELLDAGKCPVEVIDHEPLKKFKGRIKL